MIIIPSIQLPVTLMIISHHGSDTSVPQVLTTLLPISVPSASMSSMLILLLEVYISYVGIISFVNVATGNGIHSIRDVFLDPTVSTLLRIHHFLLFTRIARHIPRSIASEIAR